MNKVIDAKANEDFSLDLKFDDGSVKRFDVTPYLNLGVFRELKDADYFKQVTLAFGDFAQERPPYWKRCPESLRMLAFQELVPA